MFKSKGNHRVVQDVMMKGRNPTDMEILFLRLETGAYASEN